MSFEFQCRACQATLRIPDEARGKVVRCPNCGNTSVVEGASPTAGGKAEEKVDARGYPSGETGYQSPPAKHSFSTPDQSWGQVPESSQPPNPGLPYSRQQLVVQRVKTMSIVWLIFSILNFLMPVLGLLGFGLAVAFEETTDEDYVTAIFALGSAALSVVSFIGALAAMRMRYHGLCVVASVAGMMSGLICCFVPSGVSLWAMITLLLPGTRDQFK